MRHGLSNLLINGSVAIIFFTIFATPALAATPRGNAPWVGDTFWNAPCTGRRQTYGPYDYTLRNNYRKNLKVVEDYHFSTKVENLVSGVGGVSPYPDLDYTLSAWPNHHRALNTAIQARFKYSQKKFRSANYTPAECYLQRAINYSPQDGTARMLYGMLFHKMRQPEEALEKYKEAENLEPSNIQLKYNIGLVLVDLERYDEAKKYAVEVYRHDFPLPGLKRQLEEKGYWED